MKALAVTPLPDKRFSSLCESPSIMVITEAENGLAEKRVVPLA